MIELVLRQFNLVLLDHNSHSLFDDNLVYFFQGFINSVELELPNIEHMMCVRHIYENLKVKHGKNLRWNQYLECGIELVLIFLDRLRCSVTSVYEDVVKKIRRVGVGLFYMIWIFCENFDNNFTKSFNNTIIKAREKLFVHMLENIWRLAMINISKRSSEANKHTKKCTPYVVEFLTFRAWKIFKLQSV